MTLAHQEAACGRYRAVDTSGSLSILGMTCSPRWATVAVDIGAAAPESPPKKCRCATLEPWRSLRQ
ncbi:MAG: hypothetical protein QOJ03_1076 [Frankiaceae bacterium]|nr:hypothetical protein [Frankiaceae bacterium]